jgi:hypothetical protein
LTLLAKKCLVNTYEFNYKSISSTVAPGGRVEGKNPIAGKRIGPVVGFIRGSDNQCCAREKEIQNERGGQGQDFGGGQAALGQSQRHQAGGKTGGKKRPEQDERSDQGQALSQAQGNLGGEKNGKKIVRFHMVSMQAGVVI